MRTQRQLRVGEEIRHALAAVFVRGDVPLPAGISSSTITVTEVQISPDLANASVFVMPLGGLQVKETVRALNDTAGFYRHAVGQAVRLRHVPRLQFMADHSFEYAQKIDDILHKPDVARDLNTPRKKREDYEDEE